MALKKLPGSKPKGAVRMPAAKAPGIKSAAGKTTSLLGKGRRPAKPKMAAPPRMPMQPQQPMAPQGNPGQGMAGIMPGQISQ